MRYTREDGCRAWLTRGGLKYDSLASLMEDHDSAEAVYERFMKCGPEFLEDYGVGIHAAERLRRASAREEMHETLSVMRKNSMGILSLDDAIYPDYLKNISDPPILLYYIGDPDCLLKRCVTVVGSRKASSFGIESTEKLSGELGEKGILVVSGMAYGIDTAAHEGCLDGNGITAAVMACSLDQSYPTGNEQLKKRVLDSGGVLLSEYAPGTPALKGHFQVRNRILSGVSRAVIVMECRIRSGCMLTVSSALDQGRDVFAWPGRIDTEWAEGCHYLLRDGARYFTTTEDILEDMGWQDAKAPEEVPKGEETELQLDDGQRSVLAALTKEGELSFDQLLQATGMETPSLSVSLTFLQMGGLVKALPGKMYART